jgi:polyisoprenyl-phosphate glycosyltransferase
MKEEKERILIVTPVFEDSKASEQLFSELVNHFGDQVYIVAIEDGSINHPLNIDQFKLAGANGVLINLRRNYGHQVAIAVGINHVQKIMAENDILVVMDSDGEDIPKTIPILIDKIKADKFEVAVAERRKRYETLFFKTFYFFYKNLFRIMTGKKILFGNFMALKYSAVQRIASFRSLPTHLAATILASRLRIGLCPIDRGQRYSGESKMNLVSLVLHAFKGLMIFVEDVLVRVGIACASIAFCSFLGIMMATILKFLGFSTPGWFSVALGILVLMLLQTGALALMALLLTPSRGGLADSEVKYLDLIASEIQTKEVQGNKFR